MPTRGEITERLYGLAIRRIIEEPDRDMFRCIHLAESPSDFFVCPLHLEAGALCKACIADHAWTHRGKGCDYCGAPDATWDAMPVWIRPPLPADLRSHPLAEALRPRIYLIGPALCLDCASVFGEDAAVQ